MTNKIIQGDCIEELKKLPDNSVDAIVTDPPYGLGFMNKEWDNPNKQRELIDRERKRSEERKAEGKSPTDAPFSQSVRPGLAIKGAKENRWFQEWNEKWAIEAFRVLKPGGYMLVCCATRMYHRMACGIEDAGFEIRDCIQWLYGSGFPKSLNIGKQIDKINGKTTEEFIAFGKYLKESRGDIPQNQISKFFPSKTGGLTGCVSNWELGMNVPTKEQWIILKRELKLNDKFDYLIDRIEAEREVIGKNNYTIPKEVYNIGKEKSGERGESLITAPATPEAKEWEGWGTALKPANEPIVVARKPLSEKNVALNVLKWGTGGINIDACRIVYNGKKPNKSTTPDLRDVGKMSKEAIGIDKLSFGQVQNAKRIEYNPNQQGRFPANIILDEEAGKMLDEQSGISKSIPHRNKPSGSSTGVFGMGEDCAFSTINDKGGASRFFYCAKASKSERNEGLDKEETIDCDRNPDCYSADVPFNRSSIPKKNNHPTVKPVKLMEYLIKLVSKEGAVILDPFLGSGTTGIACAKLNRQFIGIEKEPEYIKIAEARIKPYLEQKHITQLPKHLNT